MNDSSKLENNLENILKKNVRSNFSPNFTQDIMLKIESEVGDFNYPDLFFESLLEQFKKFAASAIVIIILLISYNIFKAGEISIEHALDIPEITLTEALTNLDWSN